jgi:hypothetical protein
MVAVSFIGEGSEHQCWSIKYQLHMVSSKLNNDLLHVNLTLNLDYRILFYPGHLL